MDMIRVIIADDHKIVRDGLRQILAQTGDIDVVSEAATGGEVMQIVRSEDADVLLLDLSMPGRNGLDLIKQVRAEKPALRILILTAYDEEQFAVRTIRAGAVGYLHKDSASEQLVSVIRKIAAGGMYVSAALAESLAQTVAHSREASPHTRLSDREFEVFRQIVDGRSLSEIAARLCVSVKTVSTHKTRILEKLQLASTADLVRYAVRHRLISDPQDSGD